MAERADHFAETFESRLAFETMLADLSSRFINVSPDELDREIDHALRRVCEHLDIDLAVLWQWSSETPDVIAATHAYPPVEQVLPPEPLREEQFPWIRQEILAHRVVSLSSLEEFPPEAHVDCRYCSHYGVKSHLSIPLSIGGDQPVGLIGWNTLLAERDWPDVLVKRLQLVAQLFTNALARKRHELRLRESQDRLALAADSAGAGLWTLDFSTGVFWATKKARAIFGYTPEQVVDMKTFETSVLPEDRDPVRQAIEGSARTGEPINVEYRIAHPEKDGVRWIVSRGRPRFSPTGELKGLTGVSIDISERKGAEEALRTSEARLAAAAELAELAFYEVNFDLEIMYFDDRLRRLCGVPPDREDGLQALQFWMERLHPDDRQRVLDFREQMQDGRLDRLSLEYRYLHPTRGELWIHHLAGVSKRDITRRAVHTFGVFRDITERKRGEEELRDLSQRLIRAHEEERAILARELHDDVTQRLAVLAIEAGGGEISSSDEAQAQVLRRIREGLVSLSEDVHSLAYQLHPSVLDELGLAEALRTECERRRRQGPLELSVEIDTLPTAVVGKDAALCLFRVAQEALNNIFRHAGAHAACVELLREDEGLLLAVRDDGIGFDPTISGQRRSLGLASMRERVRLVNGTLEIESAPGRGTSIVAWVPAQGESR